ncbi:hypothetical protein SK854_40065 [Lentzea sp. BCCO 10_0061]|uniref:Uncharacterized protein n=1 Tax=Lentzea sokolovensis TaxID=3095429 RepID=A0ABU4VBQ3_9PSEU|nr:hypothetical protein [Lentzea sp. BCCO 10_0061]MDX8148366.1 hypothetical protein [Lentzea sp. BCCO 10_0061]
MAGDFAGGQFYLCGDAGSERPVLHASSEGQAGLVANNLREAVELVVGLPHRQDCLTFADFEPRSPVQEVLLARLRAAGSTEDAPARLA